LLNAALTFHLIFITNGTLLTERSLYTRPQLLLGTSLLRTCTQVYQIQQTGLEANW